jgi:hypothetical protein
MLVEEGVKRVDFRRFIPKLTNHRPNDNLDNQERDIFEALCRNEIPVVRIKIFDLNN